MYRTAVYTHANGDAQKIVCLFVWFLLALSAQIGYIIIEVGNISHRDGDNTHILQLNNE